MALFKILKGSQDQLGAENSPTKYAKEGYAYFATKTQNGETTGKMYIDIAGDGTTPAENGTNRIPLNAEKADYAENAKRDENGDRILVSYIKKEKETKQTINCPGGQTPLQLTSGNTHGALIQFTGAADENGNFVDGYLGVRDGKPVYYKNEYQPLVSVNVSDADAGIVPKTNSDQLGGLDADQYVLKTEFDNFIDENLDLSAAQKGDWDGNTLATQLPMGLTYSQGGTDKGFPSNYITCFSIKYNNDRCMQIAMIKGNATTYVRAPLSNSADGWTEWKRLITVNDTVNQAVNSNKLGGIAADQYALKSDITSDGGADWEAQEGEPGYITNKPFETIPGAVIFEQYFENIGQHTEDNPYVCYCQNTIEVGKTYRVYAKELEMSITAVCQATVFNDIPARAIMFIDPNSGDVLGGFGQIDDEYTNYFGGANSMMIVFGNMPPITIKIQEENTIKNMDKFFQNLFAPEEQYMTILNKSGNLNANFSLHEQNQYYLPIVGREYTLRTDLGEATAIAEIDVENSDYTNIIRLDFIYNNESVTFMFFQDFFAQVRTGFFAGSMSTFLNEGDWELEGPIYTYINKQIPLGCFPDPIKINNNDNKACLVGYANGNYIIGGLSDFGAVISPPPDGADLDGSCFLNGFLVNDGTNTVVTYDSFSVSNAAVTTLGKVLTGIKLRNSSGGTSDEWQHLVLTTKDNCSDLVLNGTAFDNDKYVVATDQITSSDENSMLQVVNGKWAKVSIDDITNQVISKIPTWNGGSY